MIKSLFILATIFISIHAQYAEDVGKDLCKLAMASYCKPAHLQDWSCAPCKSSLLGIRNVSVIINSTSATLGFIAISQKLQSIVLIFRGTLPWNLKNWIQDIDFISTDYPLCQKSDNCKVHEGFYKVYKDINEKLVAKVQEYIKNFNIKRIVIAGHSLGGAIAYHATAHLIKSGHKVDVSYTFGSPRVGNHDFSNWFYNLNDKLLRPRVTHGHDPVPHLPPEVFGFQHARTEIFYETDLKKGYKVCLDESAEDKTCSDKFKTDVNVLDHLSYYGLDFSGVILACQ